MAVRRVKVHMRCFGSRRGLVKAQNNRLQGVLAMLFNGSNGMADLKKCAGAIMMRKLSWIFLLLGL